MEQNLSNNFAVAGNIEPTQKTTEELKIELVVAEMRDYFLERIDDGDLSVSIDGQIQDLTAENAIEKLTDDDGVMLDSIDQSTLRFLLDMTHRRLFSAFQHTPQAPELIEATYNAAIQSALDVIIEQQNPSLGHDAAIENN